MRNWDQVQAWRREQRARLIACRAAVAPAVRRRVGELLANRLRDEFPELSQGTIGFYWPFKAELDFRPLVGSLIERGATAALPVVAQTRRPLEFWAWRPRMKLGTGIWDIPIPATRTVVHPTVLLVPLVGFDVDGYRLGYGGGYYDRTLAAMNPRPLTIGVGFELGLLPTIHPQPHDIPLDVIATEAGTERLRLRGERVSLERTELDEQRDAACASPPCMLHEVDPAYLGYLGKDETVALLNQLLEGERAGARAVSEIAHRSGGPVTTLLTGIAGDEARFCAMLSRHIRGLGATPSTVTGSFYDKLIAEQDDGARIDLLNRGQDWVVRKLEKALPQIADDALHRDLSDMLAVHRQNIRLCQAVSAT